MAAGKASAQYQDESKWLAMFDGSPRLSWDGLELNRKAERSQTADGFNIPVKHEPQLLRWSKGDASTLKWRPQGITGSREAGSPERARWLVISWYGRKEADNAQRGARISLLDYVPDSPSHLRYRHVLLVQNAANRENPELFHLPDGAPAYQQHAGFAPVTVHAGGIAWVGNLLYVADTTLGLRVFDLTRLHPAVEDSTGNRCGREGGAMYAFNYRYVLPQVGYYRMKGTAPHSFVSVGSSGDERCLWTGQYLQKATKGTPMLFAWRLQPDGHIETSGPLAELQPNDGGGRAYNMQGAYHAAGASWLSVTGRSAYKGSTARLITQAEKAKGVRWRWPHGAEDLYLEADTNTLWCLTEYTAGESPGERFVFGASLPSYGANLHPAA